MHQAWNKTFLISKKKGKLNVKLLANFIVIDVKECTFVYNDKSGRKSYQYYVVSLKNDKGRVETEVEVAYNSVIKTFQTDWMVIICNYWRITPQR